jgi:hypothetical protein
MVRVADVAKVLNEAINEMEGSGFGTEAGQIRAAMRFPSQSALEILGEIGLALLRVQSTVGHLLPRRTRLQLRRCLREVRKSWPDLKLP